MFHKLPREAIQIPFGPSRKQLFMLHIAKNHKKRRREFEIAVSDFLRNTKRARSSTDDPFYHEDPTQEKRAVSPANPDSQKAFDIVKKKLEELKEAEFDEEKKKLVRNLLPHLTEDIVYYIEKEEDMWSIRELAPILFMQPHRSGPSNYQQIILTAIMMRFLRLAEDKSKHDDILRTVTSIVQRGSRLSKKTKTFLENQHREIKNPENLIHYIANILRGSIRPISSMIEPEHRMMIFNLQAITASEKFFYEREIEANTKGFKLSQSFFQSLIENRPMVNRIHNENLEINWLLAQYFPAEIRSCVSQGFLKTAFNENLQKFRQKKILLDHTREETGQNYLPEQIFCLKLLNYMLDYHRKNKSLLVFVRDTLTTFDLKAHTLTSRYARAAFVLEDSTETLFFSLLLELMVPISPRVEDNEELNQVLLTLLTKIDGLQCTIKAKALFCIQIYRTLEKEIIPQRMTFSDTFSQDSCRKLSRWVGEKRCRNLTIFFDFLHRNTYLIYEYLDHMMRQPQDEEESKAMLVDFFYYSTISQAICQRVDIHTPIRYLKIAGTMLSRKREEKEVYTDSIDQNPNEPQHRNHGITAFLEKQLMNYLTGTPIKISTLKTILFRACRLIVELNQIRLLHTLNLGGIETAIAQNTSLNSQFPNRQEPSCYSVFFTLRRLHCLDYYMKILIILSERLHMIDGPARMILQMIQIENMAIDRKTQQWSQSDEGEQVIQSEPLEFPGEVPKPEYLRTEDQLILALD